MGRSLAALKAHHNTLAIAPTGAGKSIMLSAVTGQYLADKHAKACVLAHRDELIAQNEAKCQRVNPKLTTSVFTAHSKSWDAQVVFAMVQTLSRDPHLDTMPALDLLVIDEAHHAAAPSYRRIIEHVQTRNPKVAIFGVTATPNRADQKGLRPIFNNVADQITLAELIASGHLVPPRTFVMDVGTQGELSGVKRTAYDFDMHAVEAIMNKAPITEALICHWQAKAHDRPTVVFCATLKHARTVADAFLASGYKTELIHGALSPDERKAALARFESGAAQIIVNVFVLLEGWDFPPTSCVVLLRPSSHKSTYIQMIGRGLRTLDSREHPGLIKKDCIVLDFGISTLMHGSLEQDVHLDGRDSTGEGAQKTCPDCSALLPLAVRACPFCAYVWEANTQEDNVQEDNVALSDFIMSEIDLLKRSSFRWCDLFGDDAALMATGFEAWAGVFFLEGSWYGMGGGKKQSALLLARGERSLCLAAADDWLNEHESEEAAYKSHKWLGQPASSGQLHYLPARYRKDFGLNRYQASCLLAFQFNKHVIQSCIFKAAKPRKAA